MVKSKKRYNIIKNNIKRKILSKKNLRGGKPPNPVTINLEVEVAEFYKIGRPIDVSVVGTFPDSSTAREATISSDIEYLKKIIKEEKLVFFKGEIGGRLVKSNNYDDKINFLIVCIYYISYFASKGKTILKSDIPHKIKSFMKSKNKVDFKLEELISYTMEASKKTFRNGFYDEKILRFPKFTGIYNDKCKLKQLPINVYLCHLTKLNNISNSADKFHFFLRTLSNEDFNTIFDLRALLGEGNDINPIIDKKTIFYNCFKECTWYYPLQPYMDYELEPNRYSEISRQKDKRSYKVYENQTNYFKFLSDYIQELATENATKDIIIFITGDRIVNIPNEKSEHVNIFFGFEYLIRNINIYIEKKNKVNNKPLKSFAFCNSESINRSRIFKNEEVNNFVYDYDINYHVESSVLQQIYNDIKSGNYDINNNLFLLSLSPNKIMKFLNKIIEDIKGPNMEQFFESLMRMEEFNTKLTEDVEMFTEYLSHQKKPHFKNQYLLSLINSYKTIVEFLVDEKPVKSLFMKIAEKNPYIFISDGKKISINREISINAKEVYIDKSLIINSERLVTFDKAEKVTIKNYDSNLRLNFPNVKYLYLVIDNDTFPKLPLQSYNNLKSLNIELNDSLKKINMYYQNIFSLPSKLEDLSLTNFQESNISFFVVDVYVNLKNLYLGNCGIKTLVSNKSSNLQIVLENNIYLEKIISSKTIGRLVITNCYKLDYNNSMFTADYLNINNKSNLSIENSNIKANIGIQLNNLTIGDNSIEKIIDPKLRYLKLNNISSITRLDLTNFNDIETLVLKNVFKLTTITGIPKKLKKLFIYNTSVDSKIVDKLVFEVLKNGGTEIVLSKSLFYRLSFKSDIIKIL